MNELIKAAEKVYGVRLENGSRKRFDVWARAAIYVELYERRDENGNRLYTMNKIAKLFNRDHSTVLFSINKHVNLLNDLEYAHYYSVFQKELGYNVQIKPMVRLANKNQVSTSISTLSDFQQKIAEMVKSVPEETQQSVIVKLDAIVKMSKAKHLIK